MLEAYQQMEQDSQGENDVKTILIAPSWQKDNILDSCIEQLLDNLKELNYQVIVRPHPQYVRHFEERIDALARKYGAAGVQVQKDFSSNKTVYMADLLITDWSSIAFEYTFSTLKPVLFINTPMKILNPDYQELSTVPIDLELRNRVGISLETGEINERIKATVKRLMLGEEFSKDAMAKLRD